MCSETFTLTFTLYSEISRRVLTHRRSSLQLRLYLNILRSFFFFFSENIPINLSERVASRRAQLSDRASPCKRRSFIISDGWDKAQAPSVLMKRPRLFQSATAWWLRLEFNLIQNISASSSSAHLCLPLAHDLRLLPRFFCPETFNAADLLSAVVPQSTGCLCLVLICARVQSVGLNRFSSTSPLSLIPCQDQCRPRPFERTLVANSDSYCIMHDLVNWLF